MQEDIIKDFYLIEAIIYWILLPEKFELKEVMKWEQIVSQGCRVLVESYRWVGKDLRAIKWLSSFYFSPSWDKSLFKGYYG